MWLLEQLEGGRAAFNMPFAYSLRGGLDVESLRRAFEIVVHRHESLRTTFQMADEEPVQVIQPSPQFELPVIDLRALTGADHDEVAVQRQKEAERPFDLTADLMLRAVLLRLGEEEHVLLLTMHHIASDGWSIGVLWQEVAVLYGAYCRDDESPLPTLPIQYADYSVWQRNELQGERLERLLQYWRNQLDGATALALPTDRPRPPRPSYRGSQHGFVLRDDLVTQLRKLSQSEGVTLHMTLMAAFLTLLMRYARQDDVTVTIPIAGRSHVELEKLIGFFVNSLVLRTDLSGRPSFRELLSRVRQCSVEAYDHQELPFEKLVEEIQPQRDANGSALFQVLFQVLNLSGNDQTLTDLVVSPMASAAGHVRHDLQMHFSELPKTVSGELFYATDLFDPETIARMAEHLVGLLEGAVAEPDRAIDELPLLTESERHRLSVGWNETATDYRRNMCLHELFEEQVERAPDAVALVSEHQQLTYRQLNERANRLAHHLRELGVGPETLVAICVDQSLDAVLAILGILKAAGAYLPLDAGFPRSRLAFMLEDAGAELVISRQNLLDDLPVRDGHTVVCLDSVPNAPVEATSFETRWNLNPRIEVCSRNLAHVMYTSGSVGKPAGVETCHTSVVSRVLGGSYATCRPDRVFLQQASISYPVSALEIWGPLLCGAKLIAAPSGLLEFSQLEKLIKDNGATTLRLPATLFCQVVEQRPQTLETIDEVVIDGEALSVRQIGLAQQALPKVRLIHAYGQAEKHAHGLLPD